ncbi:hypothetical protein ASPWEDRAFT_24856 [Aspergillus wentii DTO 134E9]|uniref:Uncharacterized protein n=1 Tax=Aspergillus wentii DTO 134E9 TaxID=1073089 RepID=A0A1L9RVN7_ASPWE|nr:uncharacterized protein ASPWEDRAFT_24856 [Aspergillus wentii DTO 134E9]KAI9928880.1 hypothetical protein MW887_002103 [Aspergillus wentii]OJJ38986.1 hypothetical protein ASPWEDRAFT_24856 [Aspergillus wentii DTO 134E9]
MPEPPRRIVLEKSRTVRRRYQRSNKRFQFSASQIERIEREQERERRAKKLQENEKKRIANKKKKAEREAKAREERRRNGPDPDAFAVPSSQPLLSRFLQKPKQPQNPQPTVANNNGTEDEYTEPDSPGDVETELDDDHGSGSGLDTGTDYLSDPTVTIDSNKENNDTTGHDVLGADNDNDDDEFSECSFFCDEDTIRQAETVATALDTKTKDTDRQDTLKEAPETMRPSEKPNMQLSVGESFQDDTALLLEEYAYEFDDTDEEFEQELLQLDPV